MKLFFLATGTLWQRELVRFFRQRSRVIGALGPPVLFWFLIGSGLGNSFRIQGADINYLQYFFPGTLLLIVLFTAIFSTISVIEDRHAGFLQSVLVAPLSRLTLVLGKLLGGATIAFGQAAFFLVLAGFADIHIPWVSLPFVLGILLLLAFGLTGLGFMLAWLLDSVQGFHAIMNLFLIPLWLLSGALFPAEGAAPWIRLLMKLNPLSYGLSSLQEHLWVNGQKMVTTPLPEGQGICVLIVFALVTFVGSVWVVKRRSW
jgi:ABC-2 type transport system permease protein